MEETKTILITGSHCLFSMDPPLLQSICFPTQMPAIWSPPTALHRLPCALAFLGLVCPFGLRSLRYLQASFLPAPADSDRTSRVPWPFDPSSFLAISSHAPHSSGLGLLDTLSLGLVSRGTGRSLESEAGHLPHAPPWRQLRGHLAMAVSRGRSSCGTAPLPGRSSQWYLCPLSLLRTPQGW